MNDETIQFEVGGGNIYTDLGLADAEDMLTHQNSNLPFKRCERLAG